MPIGSVREFAKDVGLHYRTVYRMIEREDFYYPGAELVNAKVEVLRVKWKKRKRGDVKP